MMQQIVLIWRCIVGPKLYQIYGSRVGSQVRLDQAPDQIYKKNVAESLSDNIFLVLKVSIGILKVTWPLWLAHMYRKDALTAENAVITFRLMGCVAIISTYFLLLRGIGRFVNSTYKDFIIEFHNLLKTSTVQERHRFLSKYDFSLSTWTPDFIMNSSAIRKTPIDPKYQIKTDIQPHGETFFDRLFYYPMLGLGYACVNIFGRRMMFPGSLQFLQKAIELALLNGRSNLINQYQGNRQVLMTADGNNIDTIFIDRRHSEMASNGSTLVVTCEGNAGFYEVGCMSTPLESNYSVLGWNRPGFAESSGSPGVMSEINAIDAVMQYAINVLGFSVENIVVFAWSIGGYSASWTAANYQNIRALILDAVFDDVLPLAKQQMPAFAENFVEKTIRHYLDLNNVELLKMYNGPFYLIRRTQDEIMNLTPGQVETNRGNELLFEVLRYRYPMIYKDSKTLTLLRRFLCASANQRQSLFEQHCPSVEELRTVINQYLDDHLVASYPSDFGEKFSSLERERFCIYIVAQHLVCFDAQHCAPLPRHYFHIPERLI